jgi:hypothetical protein
MLGTERINLLELAINATKAVQQIPKWKMDRLLKEAHGLSVAQCEMAVALRNVLDVDLEAVEMSPYLEVVQPLLRKGA